MRCLAKSCTVEHYVHTRMCASKIVTGSRRNKTWGSGESTGIWKQCLFFNFPKNKCILGLFWFKRVGDALLFNAGCNDQVFPPKPCKKISLRSVLSSSRKKLNPISQKIMPPSRRLG